MLAMISSIICLSSQISKVGIEGWFEEVFREIAGRYELEIDTMVVEQDDIHLLLIVPLLYSLSQLCKL